MIYIIEIELHPPFEGDIVFSLSQSIVHLKVFEILRHRFKVCKIKPLIN